MEVYRAHLYAAELSNACLAAHAHAGPGDHPEWERDALTRAMTALAKLTEVAPAIQARLDALNATRLAA